MSMKTVYLENFSQASFLLVGQQAREQDFQVQAETKVKLSVVQPPPYFSSFSSGQLLVSTMSTMKIPMQIQNYNQPKSTALPTHRQCDKHR